MATDSRSLSLAEAEPIVRAFERVRERHRGQVVAPASDLEHEPSRVAEAILTAAPAATRSRKRELTEAFVDLVAFLPDEDVHLLRDYARSPASATRMRKADAERAKQLIAAMNLERASVIQQLRGDVSAVGNLNALPETVPIGDARLALDQVGQYRDTQAAGMLGGVVMFIGTAIAFLLGGQWWLVLLGGWAGGVVGLLTVTAVANRIDRVIRPKTSERFHRRLDAAHVVLSLVMAIGGTIVGMVIGATWT